MINLKSKLIQMSILQSKICQMTKILKKRVQIMMQNKIIKVDNLRKDQEKNQDKEEYYKNKALI